LSLRKICLASFDCLREGCPHASPHEANPRCFCGQPWIRLPNGLWVMDFNFACAYDERKPCRELTIEEEVLFRMGGKIE